MDRRSDTHSPHAPARSESRRRGVALTVVIGLTLAAAAAVGAASTSTAPVSRAPSVKDSPGYVPLFDPESTAEKLGRRPNAAVVSKPFRGGAQSLDALGRTVCRALHVGSKDSLMALCVTDDEFRDILWPEFPQSRPVVGLQWEDAWPILYARLNAGNAHAVRDWGGHQYEFKSLTADSIGQYKNFKLYSRLTLVAKDDEGTVHRWTWLRSVAARKGRYKIYSTED
jgi:hypothetical protein